MFKFGIAAKAAGLTEGQLRNWLARYDDLWLSDDRPTGKWRSFSFRDCLALALMRELVSFGATVPEASDAAFMALSEHKIGDPFEPLQPSLQGPRTAWLVKEENGWTPYERQQQAETQAILKGRVTVLCLDLHRLADQTAKALRRASQ